MAAQSITNLIDPPPRLTGDSAHDTVAIVQWLSAFYVKGILSGAILQPQNMDPALISLGDLVAAANQIPYFTAEDTFYLTGFTAFARSILDDADAASVRTTIGAGTVTAVNGTAPIVSSGGNSPSISISDFIASGATHAAGAVPDPGAAAGAVKYLREDATWATPPGAGDVVGPAGVTASDFAQFDGATGKLIKGGLSLSISSSLVENSDAVIASQKAVKAYADGLMAANDAMVYKGATDCSGNPNYPAADAGHTYRVSVAGKIGGAAGKVVEVGDFVICNTDGTAAGDEAAVGTKWNVIQTNLDGAVIGPAVATGNNVAVFDGASGKLIKDGGTLGTAAFTSATAYDAAGAAAAAQAASLPSTSFDLWTAYTPALTTDTGTFGALGVSLARYKIVGKTLFLDLACSATVASGAPTAFKLTLPASATSKSNIQALAWVQSNAVPAAGVAYLTGGGSTIDFSKIDGSAFAGTVYVRQQFVIEIS